MTRATSAGSNVINVVIKRMLKGRERGKFQARSRRRNAGSLSDEKFIEENSVSRENEPTECFIARRLNFTVSFRTLGNLATSS